MNILATLSRATRSNMLGEPRWTHVNRQLWEYCPGIASTLQVRSTNERRRAGWLDAVRQTYIEITLCEHGNQSAM